MRCAWKVPETGPVQDWRGLHNMSSEGSGHKHYRYRAESDMSTFLLTLERPPAEQLTHYGRAQKYAVLKLSAQRIREQLMVWIQERGLADGVARVGEPTVFNTLFVTSTPGVAQELSHAPASRSQTAY